MLNIINPNVMMLTIVMPNVVILNGMEPPHIIVPLLLLDISSFSFQNTVSPFLKLRFVSVIIFVSCFESV
jgi:hypothetical protein